MGHATQKPSSTNNLLAARLRNELAPPHSPSPQSKPGGTKRKVENEDASLNTEADGLSSMKVIIPSCVLVL